MNHNTICTKARRWPLIGAVVLMVALALGLVAAKTAYAAPGETIVINLDSQDIYFTYGLYKEGSSRAGDLTVMVPPTIRYRGWFKIQPGQSISLPGNAWVYVEQNGDRIRWSNKVELTGIVMQGSAFPRTCSSCFEYVKYNRERGLLTPDRWDMTRLTNLGYVQRTYQYLPAGRYTFTGNRTYRLLSQSFSFDFGSRDYQWHNKCWSVSGTVVDYTFSAQRKHGPSDIWSVRNGQLCLQVSTKGNQPYPGAARDRGYFSGSGTIYFTSR